MAGVRLVGVSKVFDGGAPAVNDVSIDVADGEFVVLVGPSGCGKSTLLRIVAGLEEVTAGEVWIGEREVTDLDPKDRDIAMVFQNYALYPHMTVRQNIGFGLRLRKQPKAESAERVDEVAKLLGIEDLLDRKPGQLSGGERQRVAMGRALVREPQALLMDEPLSNLDAKLRVQVRAELNRIHARLGTTTLYVTHDQIEAMTLGDRVAVMRDGVLQQLDTPRVLFHEPTNVFVASFMGSPAMNLTEVDVQRNGDGIQLMLGDQPLPAPTNADLSDYLGGPIIVGVRPTDLAEPLDGQHLGWPTIDILVDVVEELGTEANVLFRLAPKSSEAIEPQAGVVSDSEVFTATVDARTQLRARDRARLAVDMRRLHLFDTVTGLAVSRTPA
ncbi:MAG TPA: sn-glycerol-3-phosphate ABC transporter ATP-binding protein UgpC [Actinomycetes bacterium]|nr:sn-glycerol-3-phosphate ABC transporter ATP-binding protein UgpC [Actinomycetes bacterium]